ncbi:MAG: squalene/phytoene synthase family protein [Rhodobacteraceae bacterium]|nr:squalene/phytoene synthase family protein [Paracoccaceae bacterium]
MTALEQMVRQGDPDRHAVTIAAPDGARARLWPLYAFNLEIARAPYLTQEPMIAEMRLQFWADVFGQIASDAAVAAHEVATPLAELWRAAELPVALGEQMVAARRWDIYKEPFGDDQALLEHIQASSGNLMWLAAIALGCGRRAEGPVRDMGVASGLANWLVAVPALQALGRQPLPELRADAIAALARQGLDLLARARARRRQVGRAALPALLTGWQAGAVLKRAAREPAAVAEGRLRPSEFRKRGSLALRALSGRW